MNITSIIVNYNVFTKFTSRQTDITRNGCNVKVNDDIYPYKKENLI